MQRLVEFIQGQKGDLLSQVPCKTGEERKLTMWLEGKPLRGSVAPSPEPSAVSTRRDSSGGSCYSEAGCGRGPPGEVPVPALQPHAGGAGALGHAEKREPAPTAGCVLALPLPPSLLVPHLLPSWSCSQAAPDMSPGQGWESRGPESLWPFWIQKP